MPAASCLLAWHAARATPRRPAATQAAARGEKAQAHRDEARLETQDAQTRYETRKQTVEPVFGIIKSALGFIRFHLRGLETVTTEWTLTALAYNSGGSSGCRPPNQAAKPGSRFRQHSQSDQLLVGLYQHVVAARQPRQVLRAAVADA